MQRRGGGVTFKLLRAELAAALNRADYHRVGTKRPCYTSPDKRWRFFRNNVSARTEEWEGNKWRYRGLHDFEPDIEAVATGNIDEVIDREQQRDWDEFTTPELRAIAKAVNQAPKLRSVLRDILMRDGAKLSPDLRDRAAEALLGFKPDIEEP